MPRRNSLEIIECPHQYKGKCLRMNKSYTSQNFKSDTILTDDIFTYIEFFFASHKKAMKYKDSSNKSKYGNEIKYHYLFYWKQAASFYKTAKELPIESKPLLSYYSM